MKSTILPPKKTLYFRDPENSRVFQTHKKYSFWPKCQIQKKITQTPPSLKYVSGALGHTNLEFKCTILGQLMLNEWLLIVTGKSVVLYDTFLFIRNSKY